MTRKILESCLYTIGWITALPIEDAAAAAMLDEEHDLPSDFDNSINDSNSYTCGQIGKHNVVIACLPSGSYGTTSALATGMPMRTTFPNIKFGFLVGIGAGIPNKKNDVRLGDVVIGMPSGTLGGVFQYDLGKLRAEKWERIGLLPRPPDVLLKAISKMQSQHERRDNLIPNILDRIFQENPKMAKNYAHPGVDLDQYYAVSYEHVESGNDCSCCDKKQQISRSVRQSSNPEIHYGLIGSGNSLIKNPMERDKIAAMESDCICLEMEAAGLVEHFPCLVVRGISDYADSHKNDIWQRYAAASASACAVELLSYVHEQNVEQAKRGVNIAELESTFQSIKENLDEVRQDRKQKQTRELLRLLNESGGPYHEHKDRNPERVPGTCEWFTSHSMFQDWRADPSTTLLWVTADPGCGKSVLSRYLVDAVLNDASTKSDTLSPLCVTYFFFKDDFPEQRDATHAISAILSQIFLWKSSIVDDAIVKEFALHDQDLTKSFSNLWKMLLLAATAANDASIVCVLDALDECQESTRRELIQALSEHTLHNGSNPAHNIKFLVTSRPYPEFQSQLAVMENSIHNIHLRGEGEAEVTQISKEINLVIHHKIDGLKQKVKLKDEYCSELYDGLTKIQHRTYLWVYLALSELELSSSLATGNVKKAISEVGTSMYEVYEKILSKTPNHLQATRILQIIIAAYRPQSVNEIFNSLCIMDSWPSSTTTLDSLLSVERMWDAIRENCGLFVSRVDSKVYLIHQTAKEFLISKGKNQPDWSEQLTRRDSTWSESKSLRWKWSLRLDSAHAFMAEVCLRYLQRKEYEENDGDLFSLYCRHYLFAHLYECDQEATTEMAQGAINLLEGKLKGSWEAVTRRIPWFNPVHSPTSKDSILARASYLGIAPIVKCLLDAGTANINKLTLKNMSPLQLASIRGHSTVASLLITEGAELNFHDDLRLSPLQLAVSYEHDTVVSLLIAKGAEVNIRNGEWKRSPLHRAAKRGHDRIADLLITAGAEVSIQDASLLSPLHVAARFDHDSTVSMLIARGADVNVRNDEHRSPLYLAAAYGHYMTVRLLITAGATVDMQDIGGDSPLHIAAEHGHGRVVNLLIANGAQINMKNNIWHTPLSLVLSERAPVIPSNPVHCVTTGFVKLLLDHGASLNVGQAKNLLGKAINSKRYDLVELLLQYGAYNEVRPLDRGPSQLIRAIQSKNIVLVKLLMDHKPQVNALHFISHDELGWPLAVAIECGLTEICKLILSAGAFINPVRSSLRSILPGKGRDDLLLVALGNWKYEIVKVLLSHGAYFNATTILDSNLVKKGRRTIESVSSMEAVMLIPERSELTIIESVALRLFLWYAGLSFEESQEAMTISDRVRTVLESTQAPLFLKNRKKGLFFLAFKSGEWDLARILEGPIPPKETGLLCEQVINQAIRNEQFDLAKWYIFCGRDIAQLLPRELDSLLIVAACTRDLELLDRVLHAGASINNQRGPDSRTAMSMALTYGLCKMDTKREIPEEWQDGFREIARALLLKGASRNVHEGHKWTTTNWAEQFKNPWYLELFKEFEQSS